LGEGGDCTWRSGSFPIYSFRVAHRPQHPAFFETVPYNVVIGELEEGIRLHSNVVRCANEELRVGMPVEVVFDKVNDEVTLPRFRPRRLGSPPRRAFPLPGRAGRRLPVHAMPHLTLVTPPRSR